MRIENIFPTPVSIIDIPHKLSDKEIEFIENQKYTNNIGNLISEEKYILNKPELGSLKFLLETLVNRFFEEIYQPANDVSLYITQSWLAKTNKDQFHHAHSHSNSFFSGVFYIQTQESDKIVFELLNRDVFSIQTKKWNIWNCETYSFPAVQDSLIMFPSHLRHTVENKETDGERISLAFNTFIKGNLGEYIGSNELVLK